MSPEDVAGPPAGVRTISVVHWRLVGMTVLVEGASLG